MLRVVKVLAIALIIITFSMSVSGCKKEEKKASAEPLTIETHQNEEAIITVYNKDGSIAYQTKGVYRESKIGNLREIKVFTSFCD